MTPASRAEVERLIERHRAAFRHGAHMAYRLYIEECMAWADGVIDQHRTIEYYVAWFERAEGFCKAVEEDTDAIRNLRK